MLICIMELKDVVSVSGKSGLHKIIGKGVSGLVLESLDESAKRSITPVTQKVSILEDVSIYTEDSDIKLSDVFRKMEEMEKSGQLTAFSKDFAPDQVREWFSSIVPDFNRNRVYNSDIIKVHSWFQLLKGKIDYESPEGKETQEADKDKSNSKSKSVKPVKKVEAKAKTSKGAAKTTITSRKMS